MGASGIEYFTPILNLGETGILGVGALTKEVVQKRITLNKFQNSFKRHLIIKF